MKYYSKSAGAFYDPVVHVDRLPADAVEITDSVHQELLAGQSQGKVIVADENGGPILQDRPLATVEDRRASAKQQIDIAAGNARVRFISSGALVTDEYLQAESSAQSWTDAGRPSTSVPADIQAWADAAGMTAEQAADDILTTAQNWRTVLTTIRQIRLTGKSAVSAASDQGVANDMMDAAQPYINQLDVLGPA